MFPQEVIPLPLGFVDIGSREVALEVGIDAVILDGHLLGLLQDILTASKDHVIELRRPKVAHGSHCSDTHAPVRQSHDINEAEIETPGRSGRGSQPGVEVRAGMAIRNVTEYDPALSDIVIKRQPAPIIDRVREDAWTEATKCVADQFR